jgi:nucleoside 2-deoxyribosyltransferase
MRIYLSGPITGLADDTIRPWRSYAAERLAQFGEIIDPSLATYNSEMSFTKQESAPEALDRLRHGLFVIRRNRNLIQSSDIVLANLLGAGSHASVGSIGEIYWANAFGKPVIIVREAFGNVHDHAMLNAIASNVVNTLEDAFEVIEKLAAVTPRVTLIARKPDKLSFCMRGQRIVPSNIGNARGFHF